MNTSTLVKRKMKPSFLFGVTLFLFILIIGGDVYVSYSKLKDKKDGSQIIIERQKCNNLGKNANIASINLCQEQAHILDINVFTYIKNDLQEHVKGFLSYFNILHGHEEWLKTNITMMNANLWFYGIFFCVIGICIVVGIYLCLKPRSQQQQSLQPILLDLSKLQNQAVTSSPQSQLNPRKEKDIECGNEINSNSGGDEPDIDTREYTENTLKKRVLHKSL
jgi:hypothetical protein